MAGHLSYQEYYEALEAADVCLVALSSAFQAPAVPGKVPTVMTAGRPIVASVPAGNDTREILVSSRCGIAVLPDAPGEFLAVLKALKEQPVLRSELGMNGTRCAATHFEAPRMGLP